MSTFSKGDTFKHGSWSLGHARKVFREIRHKYPAGGVVSNVAAWISANKAVIPAGTPVTYDHATKTITALLTIGENTNVNGLLQEDIYLEGVTNAADITVTGTVVYAGEIYGHMIDASVVTAIGKSLPQMAVVY